MSVLDLEFKKKQEIQIRIKNLEGAQIRHCIDNWRKLTSDPEILDIVTGAHIEFGSVPYQFFIPSQIKLSESEMEIIDNEIIDLLQKKMIVKSEHEFGEYISTIFVREKEDGSHRMILNLKPLNKHVKYLHFKMDTLTSILKLVHKYIWMSSVDLKQAYYTCPIAKSHQKYLKFSWKGELYIRAITKLPNSEQSYKGKVKTHNYINRQNQSTTGKL